MSQTLGVGFVVRFLQSWFIIIIVNAILECKLWYYKAKVIHLWSVKCQMIFFLKREEPCWQALGRRQRAEPRGKARCCGAAARHGAARRGTACSRWGGEPARLSPAGGGAFARLALGLRQLSAPAFVVALSGDVHIWLCAVFGTCGVDCSLLHYRLWKYWC